ncbi:esterase/lipase family protein [Streptomyces sp. NPDC021020]|uniref:esterase/lipase family protein n=1 Tax=Streptomyces sp. NPDC021020 TaxID=3365109 RepID=UPI00378A8760
MAERPRTGDAVVLVPGVMGSELVDNLTGSVLWGLADPRWYVSAWTTGTSLEALRLSAEERVGTYGRVRATRLLGFPAFAPVLGGLSPYGRLRKGLLAVVRHPDALADFAYDWRLPVAHNGALLADFARRHLAAWSAHPAAPAARRPGSGSPPDPAPRLVLVAHSMGGLVAWHACQDNGLAALVRTTVTLGTPFFGSPKAAVILGTGKGAPLPRRRLRRLAATLPGMYDLLPAHRCVTDGDSARRLTVADVVELGGDPELAAASLPLGGWQATRPPVGHVQVVGAHQPTVQALTLHRGTLSAHRFTCRPSAGGVVRVDVGGDGTVPRESAQLPSGGAVPLAQSHGALAATAESVLVAQDAVLDRRTGPWLGETRIGLDLPDIVRAGRPFTFAVEGVESPVDVRCTVVDLATGLETDAPHLQWGEGAIVAKSAPLPPGLFQVRADGGGMSPVTQTLLSTADFATGSSEPPAGTP